MGCLQYFFNNIWFNISYTNFNNIQTDLACKYFGYKSGLIISVREDDNINLIFRINCPNNATQFEDCFISMNNDYTQTLKASKLVLICSNETLKCFQSNNQKDVSIEKYLGKCFYIFNSHKNLTYKKMENICHKMNLRPISISTREEARFIFNKIVMNEFSKKKQKNSSMINVEALESEIAIPLSRTKVLILA